MHSKIKISFIKNKIQLSLIFLQLYGLTKQIKFRFVVKQEMSSLYCRFAEVYETVVLSVDYQPGFTYVEDLLCSYDSIRKFGISCVMRTRHSTYQVLYITVNILHLSVYSFWCFCWKIIICQILYALNKPVICLQHSMYWTLFSKK